MSFILDHTPLGIPAHSKVCTAFLRKAVFGHIKLPFKGTSKVDKN
jgi:hypothetical protein